MRAHQMGRRLTSVALVALSLGASAQGAEAQPAVTRVPGPPAVLLVEQSGLLAPAA